MKPETDILNDVASKHGLDPLDLRMTRRVRRFVRARSVVAWRLKQELGWTTRVIGAYLGCSARTVCSLIDEHSKRVSDR